MHDFGIANAARVFANLPSPALYEEVVSRKEARVAQLGPLVRPGLFNTSIPVECPNVPAELLDPRTSWPDPDQYDRAAQELVGQFEANSRCHDG